MKNKLGFEPGEWSIVSAMKITDSLPKYMVSLTITHNDHKTTYETLLQYLENVASLQDADVFDADYWISRADFDAAIENDSLWEIHWYPDTPNGSCTVYGSILENALKKANETN